MKYLGGGVLIAADSDNEKPASMRFVNHPPFAGIHRRDIEVEPNSAVAIGVKDSHSARLTLFDWGKYSIVGAITFPCLAACVGVNTTARLVLLHPHTTEHKLRDMTGHIFGPDNAPPFDLLGGNIKFRGSKIGVVGNNQEIQGGLHFGGK